MVRYLTETFGEPGMAKVLEDHCREFSVLSFQLSVLTTEN
jgi:hypothetical protein